MRRRFQFNLWTLLVAMFAISLLLGAECSTWWLRFPATCAGCAIIGSLVGLPFGKAEDYAAKGAAVGIIVFLLRCLWLAATITAF